MEGEYVMEIIIFPTWMQFPVIFVAIVGFVSCVIVGLILVWALLDNARAARRNRRRNRSVLPYGGF